jgi:predicted ATPase/DNA-binding CsgD family transcriptional regulator/DNA-binding XRE family transcriptional regulator
VGHSFAALLRSERTAAGLSQVALAERAGLSRRAIAALEGGERRAPHRRTVAALTEALGLGAAAHRAMEAAAVRARTGGLGRPIGRVPRPHGPMHGRSREAAEARRRLTAEDARLLTLLGPAGVGKTRLALDVARACWPAFPDGVWFVDLSAVRDPAHLLPTVARALGLPERTDAPPATALETALAERRTLLVLDNLEQVVAAAPAISDLLAATSHLRVLATSRINLKLRWEHVLPVAPLGLPDPAGAPEEVAAAPAVRLFVERARAADSRFALTDVNAADVAALVRSLEGLPLALELAAARVVAMAPAEIVRGSRLRALDDGPADAPPRHQSLRSAIAWSYDMLPAPEQALFRGLAVFAGGWTREAAAAVAAPGTTTDPDASLRRLVDASLVQVARDREDRPRFAMLETLREFAAERLAATGEPGAARRRHAAYYADLAERANRALTGPDQAAWLAELEREEDNLRAAFDWAAEAGDSALEVRLAADLAHFWWMTGRFREGCALAESAVSRESGARDATWYRAKGGAGILATLAGDAARGRRWLVEALGFARTQGDGPWVVRLVGMLAVAARAAGHADRLPAIVGRLEAARAGADPWSLVFAARAVGQLAVMAGEHGTAAQYLDEAIEWGRRSGDDAGLATALAAAALAAHARGDGDAAAALAAEAITISARLGGSLAAAWRCHDVAARVSVGRARPVDLARLLGGAEALRARARVAMPPHSRAAHERTVAAVRAAAGERAFASAWARGREMSIEQLRAATLAVLGAGDPPPARDELTARQVEVLRLLARGATDKEIAQALVISPATAHSHVATLRKKLGADNRTRVAHVARERALI